MYFFQVLTFIGAHHMSEMQVSCYHISGNLQQKCRHISIYALISQLQI